MNRYILKVPSGVVDSPILALAVLETGVMVNILRAKVDYDEGTMVVSIMGSPEGQKKVVDILRENGVEVSKLIKNITNDRKKCVDCGACIALCPTEAIFFNADCCLEVDGSKCVRCGACVEACPVKSLAIQAI